MLQTLSRAVLAVLFVGAGVMHFRAPHGFVAVMPPALPRPLLLVYVSGVAEIAGGVGLLLPPTRKAAGIGLIALLWAVFPVNIYMAVKNIGLGGTHISAWLLWLRLPLQFVLMAWVRRASM